MVRKGNYKFMYTHGHPDLLFDLVSDPDELNNLATDQNYKQLIDDLKKQAMKDYDPDLLMLKVIESQQRRLFLKSVPMVPISFLVFSNIPIFRPIRVSLGLTPLSVPERIFLPASPLLRSGRDTPG